MRLLLLLGLLPTLILAMITPTPRIRTVSLPPAPRHAAPPRRQARDIPRPRPASPTTRGSPRSPRSTAPCGRSPTSTARAPYTARHRANGNLIAAGGLATLDWALYAYVVPPTNPDIARCRPPRSGRARAYAPAPL